jgi:hypothetical protein
MAHDLPFKLENLLLVFLIGFLAGLRSLTPLAVIAWAAHLGWIQLPGPLAHVGSFRGGFDSERTRRARVDRRQNAANSKPDGT